MITQRIKRVADRLRNDAEFQSLELNEQTGVALVVGLENLVRAARKNCGPFPCGRAEYGAMVEDSLLRSRLVQQIVADVIPAIEREYGDNQPVYAGEPLPEAPSTEPHTGHFVDIVHKDGFLDGTRFIRLFDNDSYQLHTPYGVVSGSIEDGNKPGPNGMSSLSNIWRKNVDSGVFTLVGEGNAAPGGNTLAAQGGAS